MPHLPAYSVAKLIEKNDLSTLEPGLRRRVKELAQASWSLEKVAAMETDDLEARLRSYGVIYSRERFLHLSEGLSSAWQLSEIWRTQDPVTCRGMDEDFLGFAACELWKRLLPERPSMEMIDDWLEEGYNVLLEDECQACDFWWKAWRALQPRFLPTMRTMLETSDVFQGTYLLYNWCQEFENWLLNAALHDRRFAAIGEQFCREWLAQFSGKKPGLQVNFRRSWAEFTFKIGEVEQARTILEETLDAFPNNPWSYVALADAYSHLFADLMYHLPFDLEKANHYLQLGLQRLKKGEHKVLQERLDGLKEAVPVSQKPLPAKKQLD